MGLDMYLTAKAYLPKNPVWSCRDMSKEANTIQAMFPELEGMVDDNGSSVVQEVIIRVGYWRKANQIHNWFVTNVQNGTDDCRPCYVSREKIQELLDKCRTALEVYNPSLLPPKAGCFFGSTRIDEGYWDDLVLTVNICNTALELPADTWTLMYEASW